MGSCGFFISSQPLLGDDEDFGIHPVGVTPQTQRTDLELIDSSHGQAADRYCSRLGDGHRRPRAEWPARAL